MIVGYGEFFLCGRFQFKLRLALGKILTEKKLIRFNHTFKISLATRIPDKYAP